MRSAFRYTSFWGFLGSFCSSTHILDTGCSGFKTPFIMAPAREAYSERRKVLTLTRRSFD